MNSALFSGLNAYDGVGACSLGPAGADGLDRINKIRYDAKGQVVQMRRAVGTPLEQAEVTYGYTENRQKKYVIDANGNKAEYQYDGHDRLTQWRFPNKVRPSNYNDATPASAQSSAGTSSTTDYEQYGYDANDNRVFLRKRDASMITYQYDALNRNTVKIIPERSGLDAVHSRDVYYQYDLRGLQIKARFDSLSGPGVDNIYDGFGRMRQSINGMSGTPLTLNYIYDDNSNRTGITNADGKSFSYEYDILNRETSIRELGGSSVKNAYYNNRGLMRLNGVVSGALNGYTYDSIGRLTRINNDLAGTNADNQFNFTYNPASQINSRTITNDAYTDTAHYDVQRPYQVNGLNQYIAAGPAAFTYDGNGNLTSDGGVNFVYDVENRLVEASGGRTATLIYDPLGRLWEVNQGSTATTTNFLYDGDALITEYGGLGNILRRYVHGGGVDQPFIWYEGDTVDASSRRGLIANHQGSIAAIADSTGNAIAINGYDAYGIPNETNIGRFQYTGQIWLPELGLYYYKARIYSPTLGRFLQTDPIGYEDQYNLYAYVGNDPINGTDPTGMCGVDADGNKAGLCAEEGDTAGANLISAQLSNPNSIASGVNAQLIAQGINVPVTTDPEGTNSTASVYGIDIGLKSGPIEVSDVGSASTYTMTAPIDEVVEHEIGHVEDELAGGIPSGTGVIDVSGFEVDLPISVQVGDSPPSVGNSGAREASAVNKTNEYRRRMGRGYRRVTY